MYNKKIVRHKKFAGAVICAALIAATTLTSCGSTTAATSGSSAAVNEIQFKETTFTGTISGIDGNSITLTINSGSQMAQMGQMSMPQNMDGTQTQGGMPDAAGTSSDSSTENSGAAEGTSGTGTDNTQMGQAPSMPGGDGQTTGGDGQAPSMPTGDGQTTGGDGQAPSMPTGDGQTTGGDGQAPSMPGGDGQTTGGDGQNTSTEVPAKSDDGSASADTDSTEVPSMPSDMSGAGGDMQSDSITVVITLNDTSVLTDTDGNAVELSTLAEGDSLTVTVDSDGNLSSLVAGDSSASGSGAGGETSMSMPGGGMGGQSTGVDSYTAVTEFLEDTTESGKEYASTGTDENAIHIYSGASVTIDNASISRTSSDSTGGDNSSFYGVGSAVLVTDGNAYISDSTIDTDAAGGAGVFAYGDGTAYVSNTKITTTQDTSGGIHAAGGGTLYAWDCDVETNGESSAAIRSDRGGGTMVVDGGTYTSNGTGSPAIYCTADITVNNADLTANGSEAICIEGLNTIRLFDSNLTGNMSDNEQNDCTWNVIVYQSMSGDSEVGNGTFSMIGGTLTAENGGMFYTTNTDSTFYLSNVDITYADENDFFLKCTGNSNARGWGSSGSNGAQCNFTAEDQEMEGDIVYDSISTLDFYMVGSSSLTGAVVDDESNAGNGGDGYCNLYLDKDAVWTVTADSTLTSLYNEGSIVDESGKTVTIKGSDGTVYVQGDSSLTITVENYSTSADLSGASQATSFSDYSVENPF